MNSKFFNLALMVMWLSLCLGLLTREWWMPDGMKDRVTGPNTPVVIGVAALLATWNFAASSSPIVSAVPPGRPRKSKSIAGRFARCSGEDPKVTDPQLNFTDPPPERRRPTGTPRAAHSCPLTSSPPSGGTCSW